MTILIALLALFDAAIFPVRGTFSSILFLAITGIGIWQVRKYQSWFILSLVFITLAASFYFIGGKNIDETVIQKLSDWSYIYLILGIFKLAHAKHD